jgi:hypothetical protein
VRSETYTNDKREVNMATELAVQLDTRCPVCGADLISFDKDGHVALDGLRPVPLHRIGDTGEGYAVCDECAFLAHLSEELTLN